MPFLAKLTPKGIQHLADCLHREGQNTHRPHLRKLEDWVAGGVGYSTAYPQAVQRALVSMGPEALAEHTHDLLIPSQPESAKTVKLPGGSVNLKHQLVPAVRQMLAAGLSEQFQRACVRLGTFDTFSGGMKAGLVGGLRIDVHAVLKLDTAELRKHALLMAAVNQRQPGIFPSVLHEQTLSDGRVLLITEECRKHSTLLQIVFEEKRSQAALAAIVGKTLAALDVIHSIAQPTDSSSLDLPLTPDPFSSRLFTKIPAVLDLEPSWEIIQRQPGEIDGTPCPPLNDLLSLAQKLCQQWGGQTEARLVHGDAHLGNVLSRRYGSQGHRVRLIDPNPTIGFSQPIYDYGKLLHWAELVGWAKLQPALCHAQFSASASSWSILTTENMPSLAADQRKFVESLINDAAATRMQAAYGSDFHAMLAIATASAHLGMAALLTGEADCHVRRYVFAHALKRLSRIATP
jgi:hypothetical protein